MVPSPTPGRWRVKILPGAAGILRLQLKRNQDHFDACGSPIRAAFGGAGHRAMNESTPTPLSLPELSVLVPTHGRPEALHRLVEELKGQTLDPQRFELIVVDDGGDPAANMDPATTPFRSSVLRQPSAGPGAARNAGLALCRAPLVLILNDDAVPSPDLLEKHLAAHRQLGPGHAVLGSFRFTENARRSAFTRLLDESDLLFGFSALVDEEILGWEYFWTCNISLAREAIGEVGGFDSVRFDKALAEDVELGYRLVQNGLQIVYRDECRAEHEHVWSAQEYMQRALRLGKYAGRLAGLHGVPGPLGEGGIDRSNPSAAIAISFVEDRYGDLPSFLGLAEELEKTFDGIGMPADLAEEAKSIIDGHARALQVAGAFQEETGVDPLNMMENGPPAGTDVAIVIVSCNALANTRRCIETLRAKADSRFPQTLYVTDNGSTDGSLEWLEGPGAGPDLQLIRNPFNYGAPRARNQALLNVGDQRWICFLDNDVFVTEGWLERALYHGEVDPLVGSVALCAGRASKHQVVPYDGPDDQASLDGFASAHYAVSSRRGKDTTLFTSFGVLVRAEIMGRIGGFDEAFSPWGFEDDDLSLRIVAAGWRNRVARDTFVHHAAYGNQAKAERHDEWMRTNWETFLAKWSPTAVGSPLFDYSKFGNLEPGDVTEAQIRFELPAKDAPLPEWAGCSAERLAAKGQTPHVNTGSQGDAGDQGSDELASVQPPKSVASLHGAASEVLGLAMGSGQGSAWADSTPKDVLPPADGPVFIVSPSARAAAELARALGWNSRPHPGMRSLNEYLLAGSSLLNSAGLWIGDPLGEVPNSLAGAPAAEVDAVLQPGAVHSDPRLAATLHAWLDHVPGARVVFVVTDPSALPQELAAAAAADPECEGMKLEEGNAVGLWLRTTQRALELSREGRGMSRWCFVMAEDLGDPGTQAEITAFTGLSMRAPASFGASAGAASVTYPSVAPTYDAARAKARGEELTPATAADALDLTVVLDVSGSPQAWAPCLESLERQSLDASAFEIVACCRDTEALQHLRNRESIPVVRVIDAREMTLGAARNAAIAGARGAYAVFLDAGTRPALDLLEQHLIALAAGGPDRVIRGPVIPFGEAQGLALARLLTAVQSPTSIAGEDPGGLYEWPRFDASNLCVSVEAMRSVGLFDAASDDAAFVDMDLGYRLQTETGARIVVAHGACTESLVPAALSDWRDRIRKSYGAAARLVAQHPGALTQRDWRPRLGGSVDGHREMIRMTLEGRGRAEALAETLASVDVGSLERAGEEGADIAEVLIAALAEYLVELESLYRADGELEAFQALGVTGFQELLEKGVGLGKHGAAAGAPPEPTLV